MARTHTNYSYNKNNTLCGFSGYSGSNTGNLLHKTISITNDLCQVVETQ